MVYPTCNNNGKLTILARKTSAFVVIDFLYAFSGNAHVDLKMVNGSFYDRAYFIETVPFFCIQLNTRKHPQFHVFVGIRCLALLAWNMDFHSHIPTDLLLYEPLDSPI